ncbi:MULTISPECIES: type III secretion protein [unclassified Pseudomonas]|uniref:type III secretion protein n=1 Tax=unclassified Pseudomonas TaxID=196821 RepID=UPI002114FD09|nr:MULTISPECIES: type III secretion protein [unclassified Pseudomonas]
MDKHWIQWWCAPWHVAHRGWIEPFVEACGWPMAQAHQLLLGRHSAFLSSVGIAPTQPPEPNEGVVQWLRLTDDQRHQALQLAASICLGLRVPGDGGAADEAWCRAVAKALRPGAWLDPATQDPRALLAAWAGEACWSRLRLSWAPDALQPAFNDLPSNKLQTLWQAVLWRVSRG